MSEFLAEAQVLIRPNTAAFRADLQKQLLAATRGVVVPISVTPVAAKGVAGAAAATQALATSSTAAARSSAALSGAQATLTASTQKSTAALLGAGSATARLDAALLGLRTAVGSTAVIGLGALALAAIAAGKAIRASIQNFASFEQELSTFRATAEATAAQMEAVRERAEQLGADVRLPAVSAADAAVAMTELAKAGLTVEDALDGAEGVLQLATAAQISNAEASKIAANALNAFGLAGDQATRVADDFANAANAAQGSIADIGLALQQSAAVARQVGLSLEDTTALLSLFAKNGLQGSDAGTSLRVALIRLVAPTKQAAAEIKKLGLDIRDAQGNVRADVFAQFGEATKNLAPAARDAAAALIFGQDAIRAVSIGAREGADGLRLMQFEIDQQGTAAEVASARTEGLAGALSGLQSNAQTLSIDLGRLASPVLTNVATGFSNLAAVMTTSLQAFEKWNRGLKDFIDSLPGGRETNDFIDFFATPGKAFSETAATLNRLINGSDQAQAKIRELNDELQALQTARIAAEKGGQSGIADQLTKEINALRDEIKALKAAGQGITGSVTDPLQKAVEELEKVRATRISLNVDTGPIDRLIASLQKSIPITQQTEGNIQRLRDDFLDLGSAGNASASGVDALTKALADLQRQSSSTQAELLRLQTEGGTPGQQIGALQRDIDIQREIIAEQKRRGGAPGSATAIKRAREQILRDQAQIDSLQTQITSDAKAAATEAKRKAKEAQDARDEQFQAIADSFGGRQEDIENQIERAGIRDNIAKQIRLNKALIASLLKERKVLLDRLKNLKVSAEVRKRILQAINAALEEARQDQIRLQQEQQENINRAINTRLDLRIQLAEARDDVAAQIKARRAKLAQITKELVKLKNAGKKNTIAWLELKVQQAEEIAAIRDLEKKTKEKNQAGKSMFFEFLQTQQGFAANLLGNLIPGFATRGLVGGSSAAAQPQGPADLGAGPQQRVDRAAAVGAARERGVRPVQVDTTNSLLRQILAALQGRHTTPPEARHNRAAMGAGFDTLGPDHGF